MKAMRKPIDGARVKALRERQKLSQKELADRAKISTDSLSRIERNRQTGKARNTAEGLSRTLGVSLEVLTGEAPMPDAAKPEHNGDRYQIDVRVDGAVRNAFALAALRYKIPASQIVELAPFLFVVAAEQSLRRRSARVAELENAIDTARELGEASRSYLLRNLAVDMGYPPHQRAHVAGSTTRPSC
jgi:transcriptional regulator with XRE-family HTH domain